MPTETTAAPSGANALLVQFDDLCALARDGLVEGDFDVAVAAFAAAEMTMGEYRAAVWADERLQHIRAGAAREAVAS